MGYTPPKYNVLRVNTLNMEALLSNSLKRYQISPSVIIKQTSLEILIARANDVIHSQTDRVSARDVIENLVNELRPCTKQNDDKNKQATLFLLGALVHRYLRLIKEYDHYHIASFWVSDPRGSQLFNSIRKALRLEDHSSQYRITDLKILDATTIVSCLEVFRSNMLAVNEQQIPRYKRYKHLAQDVNFESHLNELIEEHTKIAAPVLKLFKAIQFLQSVVKQLDEELAQVELDLNGLVGALKKQGIEWASIDCELIENLIGQLSFSESSSSQLIHLLYTPFIQVNLNTMNDEAFVQQMKSCHADIATYRLFGAYVLLIKHIEPNKDLNFCFQKVLGIENIGLLTVSEMLTGIKFFSEYISCCDESSLNGSFFGHQVTLESLVLHVEKELFSQEDKSKEFQNSPSLSLT